MENDGLNRFYRQPCYSPQRRLQAPMLVVVPLTKKCSTVVPFFCLKTSLPRYTTRIMQTSACSFDLLERKSRNKYKFNERLSSRHCRQFGTIPACSYDLRHCIAIYPLKQLALSIDDPRPPMVVCVDYGKRCTSGTTVPYYTVPCRAVQSLLPQKTLFRSVTDNGRQHQICSLSPCQQKSFQLKARQRAVMRTRPFLSTDPFHLVTQCQEKDLKVLSNREVKRKTDPSLLRNRNIVP